MNKEVLAALIDAYADAKASKNKILIQSMIEKLEGALNELFPETSGPLGVDITDPAEY
jgi:hypothetical protein